MAHGGPNHFAWTRPGMMLQVGTFLLKIVGLPSFKINRVVFKTSERVPTWLRKNNETLPKQLKHVNKRKAASLFFFMHKKCPVDIAFLACHSSFISNQIQQTLGLRSLLKGQILQNFHPFH